MADETTENEETPGASRGARGGPSAEEPVAEEAPAEELRPRSPG